MASTIVGKPRDMYGKSISERPPLRAPQRRTTTERLLRLDPAKSETATHDPYAEEPSDEPPRAEKSSRRAASSRQPDDSGVVDRLHKWAHAPESEPAKQSTVSHDPNIEPPSGARRASVAARPSGSSDVSSRIHKWAHGEESSSTPKRDESYYWLGSPFSHPGRLPFLTRAKLALRRLVRLPADIGGSYMAPEAYAVPSSEVFDKPGPEAVDLEALFDRIGGHPVIRTHARVKALAGEGVRGVYGCEDPKTRRVYATTRGCAPGHIQHYSPRTTEARSRAEECVCVDALVAFMEAVS